MTKPLVPFLDLRAQHDPLRPQLRAAFEAVIDTSAFAGGPLVTKFEHAFASFCQTKEAVGVGNGTDAIWLALLALGVGPGDEVITVSATFIATAEAITYCGAKPVFIDVDPRTYTMDPAHIERAISPRTKAIIPVHLYGQMADMDPILEIARRHGLPVVEDACQAHGAEYKGRRAGSLGVAGCFSFYPGKNLGAMGEAGAVVCNDPELAQKMRVLRDHGQETKYHHRVIGWNARMDGLQGAILSIKLPALDAGNAARRAHAKQYDQSLSGLPGVITPYVAPHGTPVFHLYVLRVKAREALMQRLADRGIATGIHYPKPVHLQAAYTGLGMKPGSLPVTEQAAIEVVSLPMYPELTPDQVSLVCREMHQALQASPPAFVST